MVVDVNFNYINHFIKMGYSPFSDDKENCSFIQRAVIPSAIYHIDLGNVLKSQMHICIADKESADGIPNVSFEMLKSAYESKLQNKPVSKEIRIWFLSVMLNCVLKNQANIRLVLTDGSDELVTSEGLTDDNGNVTRIGINECMRIVQYVGQDLHQRLEEDEYLQYEDAFMSMVRYLNSSEKDDYVYKPLYVQEPSKATGVQKFEVEVSSDGLKAIGKSHSFVNVGTEDYTADSESGAKSVVVNETGEDDLESLEPEEKLRPMKYDSFATALCIYQVIKEISNE